MTHDARSLQAAFGYLFEEEVDALFVLVRALPANPRVLQIGAGAGTASLAVLEARTDVNLTTVDIQDVDSPYGCLYAERQVVEAAGYADRLSQIHGDSKAIGHSWGGPAFDMIFIDGDHSYEGCSGDILAWLPHLRDGGTLAVHDYNKEDAYRNHVTGKAPHPRVWVGVDKAVNEFLTGYTRILLVRSLIAFKI